MHRAYKTGHIGFLGFFNPKKLCHIFFYSFIVSQRMMYITIHHKRISGTFFDLILSQKHVDVVKLACCLELPTGQGVTSASMCWKLFFHEDLPFFDGNLPDEKYSCRFLHLRRVIVNTLL